MIERNLKNFIACIVVVCATHENIRPQARILINVIMIIVAPPNTGREIYLLRPWEKRKIHALADLVVLNVSVLSSCVLDERR